MTSNVLFILGELYLFGGVALALHYRSRRFGMAPLLVYLGGLVAVLHGMTPLVPRLALGGGTVVVSSLTEVPVILLILLVLYHAEGTSSARVAIVGILGVGLLVFVAQFLLDVQRGLPGGAEYASLPHDASVYGRSWRATGASLTAFLASLYGIVVVYQALAVVRGRWVPWLAPGGALLAALLLDELAFSLVTGRVDLLESAGWMAYAGKGAAALALWPMAAWYLVRVAPRLEGHMGPADRRPLDVIFGTYRAQELALRASRGEHLRAQKALEATEHRFRTTFEEARIGLIHADEEGRIQLANRAMCDFLQRGPEEIRGMPWTELAHPDDREVCRAALQRLRAGKVEGFELDHRYRLGDGSTAWAHDAVSMARGGTHERPYLVVATEDLRERRATEERVRHLERMEAVGQLTGGIAHDFNNLLTVVMGGVDMALEAEGDAAERRRALEDARDAARRGADLTQRLLAFSRKQSLQPTSIEPRALLANLNDLLARTLGEDIQTRVEVGPDAGPCRADQAQMMNAVINLALNARDAMPGGGLLRLRADRVTVAPGAEPTPDARAGTYVRISVVDNGTGIPRDQLPYVFEPFFTTKETGKGSGLGLSMVYGFVQQSGGFVTVESEEGKGTAVRLHLPPA